MWWILTLAMFAVLVLALLLVTAQNKPSPAQPKPNTPNRFEIMRAVVPVIVGSALPLPETRPPLPPPLTFLAEPAFVTAPALLRQTPPAVANPPPKTPVPPPNYSHPPTPVPPTPLPPPDTRPKLRVATYNLRLDVDEPPNDWDSRSSAVVQTLKMQGEAPDVICTQESSTRASATLRFCLPAGFRVVGVQKSRDSDEALHVFVNNLEWNVLDSATYVFTEHKGPALCTGNFCTSTTVFGDIEERSPRIFTHVKLGRFPGLVLHVINLQLSQDEELQHRELEQLADFMAEHVPPNVPTIVTGGFRPEHGPLAGDSPLQRFLAFTGLQDSLGLEDQPTTSQDWVNVDAPGTVHRQDFVLFNNLECLDSQVGSVETSSGTRASDHEAVFATFALPAPQQNAPTGGFNR